MIGLTLHFTSSGDHFGPLIHSADNALGRFNSRAKDEVLRITKTQYMGIFFRLDTSYSEVMTNASLGSRIVMVPEKRFDCFCMGTDCGQPVHLLRIMCGNNKTQDVVLVFGGNRA